MVFDPSNFVKNSLTAAQTAEQIMVLSSQYEAQLKQFETQLLQLKNIPKDVIDSYLSKNQADLDNSIDFGYRVQSIYGSISQIQVDFQKKLDAAKLMNMDWNQYVLYEKNRIDRNQNDAISISANDISSISRLKRDYEFATELEGKISSTAGIHEAMQILNVQINRIITQNADLLRTLNISINKPNSGNNLLESNLKDQLELNRKIARDNLERSRYLGEVKVFNLLGTGFFKSDK